MSSAFPWPQKLNLETLKNFMRDSDLEKKQKVSVVRYLRQNDDGDCHTAVMMLVQGRTIVDPVAGEHEIFRMLGFYYGYEGGGAWSDGTFIVDGLNSFDREAPDVMIYDGDEASESDDVPQDDVDVLESLRKLAFEYIDLPDEGSIYLMWTEEGRRLMDSAGSTIDDGARCFADHDFNGSWLHHVSLAWPLTLTFDE